MKIGIVNNMPMAIEALLKALLVSDEHQVIWTAENGADAISRTAENPPDLILMDLVMPVMDGIEATRRIMQSTPCNILVVTASVSDNSGKVFEAIGAGALDVVATPRVQGSDKQNGTSDLLRKIDRIAKISQFTPRTSSVSPVRPAKSMISAKSDMPYLVAIGCSTGGPQALLRILSSFSADFPVAVVAVQHMDKQFTQGLANWLNSQVSLNVKVVVEGERPRKGTVLIPSTNHHVIMKPDNTLGYSVEPLENYYHPSVDVFFNSLARHWPGNCLPVILTGMGKDGAEGMLALKQNGHYSIAQDQKSSVVFGMPKAAVEAGAVSEVLPLDEIGAKIRELLLQERRMGHHG